MDYPNLIKIHAMQKTLLFIGILTVCACTSHEQENSISNDLWKLEYNQYGLHHISNVNDPFQSNVLGGRLDANIRFRMNDGEWQTIFRRLTTTYRPTEHEATFSRQLETEPDMLRITDYKPGMPFSMEQTFRLAGDAMEWDIVIENQMFYHVDIGDLFINIPISPASGDTQTDLFEGGYLRHFFISGDGSFIFFNKRSGNPPYLLLTVKPGTSLEYFEGSSNYYIHSGYTGTGQMGTWRQDHTFSELAPKGQDNDRLEFGFRLHWANSYDELRDLLYENNLIDVRVVPGMTVPEDLEARFSLRTKAVIDSVTAEFPEDTELKYLGEPMPDYHLYSVKFNRLGENMLTVNFDGERKTYLEFFSTEPVETLLSKRASFIVNNQQHRDPNLWYDGLYSIWDMTNSVLRGPDDTDGNDGWYSYRVACDDPVLGIAPYLASINALFPNEKQIESLEYYLENHLWGGLQRTDEETYPYGIMGVPNFKVARDTMLRAQIENRRLDKKKIWRTYDYPHVFMLYYHMYQIAERYPDKVSYLDAGGYLERMWQTARAFFAYPYEIYSWYDIYKWGNYNEMLIPEIIELLEDKGRQEEADWLRAEWEKKAKYFIYDDPYPYRSEFPTDRTHTESTYALARYGATNDMEPQENLWYDKNLGIWYSHTNVTREAALEFMERQHLSNLAIRGWLEPAYYTLGSALRDSERLGYMARMGGWSVLDYGIHFADDPHDWLQLGYASYLSSFALMNTGRPETNYGFWYPGRENDGAIGQALTPFKQSSTWMGYTEERGPWRYDSEQNLGMGAVTRMASTILADDPLFGWIAYGGKLEKAGNGYRVTPRDGVRIRFWLIDDQQRVGIELDRDGFKKENPILVSNERDRLEFVLENRTGTSHPTRLTLDAKGPEVWRMSLDGEVIEPILRNDKVIYTLNIYNHEHKITLQKN